MRAVADTNIVVSGLFWHGAPRQVLDAARAGRLELVTSFALLDELLDVIGRTQFQTRLRLEQSTPAEAMSRFASIAIVVTPIQITPTVLLDPDDDAVLECALGGQADFIISGDRHLLALGSFNGIAILSAGELLKRLP